MKLDMTTTNPEEIKEIIAVDQETGELYIPKEVIDHIEYIEKIEKMAKKKKDEMRKLLKAAMEQYGVTKIDTDNVIVNYVAESEQIRVDSKLLKELYPKTYDNVTKVVSVSSTVKIKVK